MAGYWTFVFVCLFSFHCLEVSLVAASGTVRFRLIGYELKFGRHNFECMKTNGCKLDFIMTLGHEDEPNSASFITTQRLENGATAAKFNHTAAKPFILQFKRWTEKLVIRVDVHISDTNSIYWFRKKRMKIAVAAAKPKYTLVSKVGSKIHFRVDTACDRYFFGADCSKYCRPQDEEKGHYNCSSTGDKRCLPNWLDAVTNCTVPEPCRPNRCRNTAACEVKSKGNFICHCPHTYRGRLCEIRRTPCELTKPCRNSGRCLVVNGSAVCWCPPGYNGLRCEIAIGTAESRGLLTDRQGGKESQCQCPNQNSLSIVFTLLPPLGTVLGLLIWFCAKRNDLCSRLAQLLLGFGKKEKNASLLSSERDSEADHGEKSTTLPAVVPTAPPYESNENLL